LFKIVFVGKLDVIIKINIKYTIKKFQIPKKIKLSLKEWIRGTIFSLRLQIVLIRFVYVFDSWFFF
jgi:hypothetical protein